MSKVSKIVIELKSQISSQYANVLSILKSEDFEVDTEYREHNLIIGYLWEPKIEKLKSNYDFIKSIAKQ